MAGINFKAIYAFAREMYPKKSSQNLEYGTAGFRGNADDLDSIMYRMGILATLRSRHFGGSVIGVMITASHNPECDNGVKIIDPKGEMLDGEWEKIANEMANVSDQNLEEQVIKIIKENDINIKSPSAVYIGMDNRYHSPRLLKAVADGILTIKGSLKEFGIVTTPMMHYFVATANLLGAHDKATESAYINKLSTAFVTLNGGLNTDNYKNRVIFDGANGVGANKMLKLLKAIDCCLNVQVFNKGEGKINYECGADFVKVYQQMPKNCPRMEPYTRCVSVDGDADRIVYFFIDENNQFYLLDGDRIAALIASHIVELLEYGGFRLNVGVVQTAYANSASTDYLMNRVKVAVACVPTGVKHLHQKALEYDIGIYFEANGHGTVVFSDAATQCLQKHSKTNPIACKLMQIKELINETVGDALADMLLVETILKHKNWDVKEWYNFYEDLPNKLLKIQVNNRYLMKTEDAGRICVKPEGLQKQINVAVAKYNKGRSFVRPSGTENVVRVYAEAATKIEVESLACDVGLLVQEMLGSASDAIVLSNLDIKN